MKVTTKPGETVITDDRRIGISLGKVPEPEGLNSDAVFDTDDPPETTAEAASQKDSRFGHVDDDVLVCFILRYIGTTPAMSLAGRFAEEMDLFFLDHTVDTVAETAVGRRSGRISGHFGSAMSAPEALNDSVEYGDRLPSHHNCSFSGFARCNSKYTNST
jgi:hypothetical protein